jgi:glyoxylase-like metal-dependent hydrolase (beta-lactamase superfamily II)
MKWLAGFFVVVLVLAGVGWWALLDARAPAQSRGEFDIAAYRALVSGDAPEALPTEVRIEFVGESEAPAFAAEAGAFGPQRTFTYASFQIVAPDGGLVLDGAVDAATLQDMSDGKGRFDEAAYNRVLGAMETTPRVMITHEHLDHVMAVARHPRPELIAPHLALTPQQLDALPQFAVDGALAPAIANTPTLDLSAPTRLAPGIVAAPMPGHTPGTIVIYVRAVEREYLFIGDIAWVMSSIENLRGRPRLIRFIMPAVDPDRPAVLSQLRALHDLAAAEPGLIILPAHDKAYLQTRIADGSLEEGFAPPAPASAPLQP